MSFDFAQELSFIAENRLRHRRWNLGKLIMYSYNDLVRATLYVAGVGASNA